MRLRRSHRTPLVLPVLAVLALALTACPADDEVVEPEVEPDAPDVEPDEPDEDEVAAPEGDPIRIGGTLGLTGAFAGPSEHYRSIYEAAVEDINAEGGLLGRPVELVLYDDESTQATAQTLYQRLIDDDQVDLLLAPYTTFVGGAVIPVVRGSGRLMVNAGFVGWELARQYDRIFFTWTMQEPTWTTAFFDMIANLPDDEQPERMAVFTAQNPFTLLVRDGVDDQPGAIDLATELGIDVVVNEEHPGDVTDVSALVQRAIDADADLLLVLGLPDDSVLFARTVAEQGYTPEIYCTCGSTMTTFPVWQELGPAGEHVFAALPAWSTDDYPGMDVVVEVFEGLGITELPGYAPVAYAALQVMQEAVEATGSLDGSELAEYIYANEFDTAAGRLVFDEFGVPEFDGVVLQYVDGSNSVVWPPDRAAAEPVIPRP